jgi:hypothetical protein
MDPIKPIQPLTTRPPEISVVEPVSPALERVKRVLFQPFSLGKWFVIGFGAWLAHLGESGGFHFSVPGGGGNNGGASFQHEFEHARDFVLSNLGWILPLVALAAVAALALWLLTLWLNSRGKFVFLHCVALDKAEVSQPWNQFARQGNSLFLFRLGLMLIAGMSALPLVTLIVLLIVRMALRGEPEVGGILVAAGLGLILVGLGIVFGIIQKLTTDFVVPIMFLRRSRCMEAWRELGTLLSVNVGRFILYLLFTIVLGMAIGLILITFLLVTCCVCCLALLPYVGTVIVLPVLMFKRAYSLYFLAQFGPKYDVFATAPPGQLKPT